MDNFESCLKKLDWKPRGTEWIDYYNDNNHAKQTCLLPLLLDLNNPTGIGWENEERMSLLSRASADTVFSLALIHHLTISNNLPLPKIANFFSKICDSLIIEFIPKDDLMVQRLLANRKDIIDKYTQTCFGSEFAKFFKIIKSETIKPLFRTLYLMKKNNHV